MASITIRNLDEDIKRRLRIRAAENGRSMEEEVRDVLRREVVPSGTHGRESLWRTVRAAIEPSGGVELELPGRTPPRATPRFED